MKIALLGNMNNNHFALLRYLRDVNIDAYLLLYIEDGKGANSHFKPENDQKDYKWHWVDVKVTSATALSCQGELVRDLGKSAPSLQNVPVIPGLQYFQ